MPSSNKTLHLALNKWIGTDKPKKDDFNDDNQIIDEAMNAISARVQSLDGIIEGLDGAVNTTLAAHTSDSAAHVTGAEKTSWNNTAANLSSHQSNSGIHVTAAEKESWSKGAELVVGSYTGNGSNQQKITLGFHAQFGLIFAVNDGIVRSGWASSQLFTNCGCISRLGCSLGLSLQSDGFTASYAINSPDGNAPRLNTSNVQYIYFIWK